MTIREFREVIEFNIENGLKHAILGLGAPGIGKSQVVKAIGEKYGYTVIDLRLAQMSEVEIAGLIYPNADKTKTVWLAPDILPNEERDGDKTILLLDEITSCSKRVQVAAYQLILDRRIGQYTLPEGTVVIALGNRENDNGVYVNLASPLANRFEIHDIDIDIDCWFEDFADVAGIHELVIKFLRANRSSLHTQKESEGEMVFATPRSWERVSDILKIDEDITKPVIQQKIVGNIGAVVGGQFIAFCKMEENILVDVDDVLKHLVPVPASIEEQRTLVDALIARVSFIEDVIDYGLLSAEKKTLLCNTIALLFDFPSPEMTVLGIRELNRLNGSLAKTAFLSVDTDNMRRFIKENGAIAGEFSYSKLVS